MAIKPVNTILPTTGYSFLDDLHRRKLLLPVILVFAAVVFSPVFQNDFIYHGDDDAYVLNNPLVRSLSWSNLKKIFFSFVAGNYHPLTILSLAVEYHFSGPDPFYYHTTNYLLHLVNIALVYFFCCSLGQSLAVSALCAALFAVHPLHAEPVAWIASRKDLLFTLFYLLALLAYTNYFKKNNATRFLFFTFLFFIFSLLSKPFAVTLPIALLLLDYFYGRLNKYLLLLKIPFLLFSVLAGILAIRAQQELGAMSDLSASTSMFNRIALVSYSFCWYIVRTFIPAHLSVMHYYPIGFTDRLPAIYYLSVPALAFLFWFLFRIFKKNKLLFTGLSFYLITIAPVVQVIPVGQAIVAERYYYLPSLGIFFIISVISFQFANSAKIRNYLNTLFYGFVLLVFSVLTFSRLQVWENQRKLFNDVIKKYPDHGHAWWIRGLTEYRQKNYEAALLDIDQSVKKGFMIDDLRFCRAVSLLNLGYPIPAVKDLSLLLAKDPLNTRYLFNRSKAYEMNQQYDSALADLNTLLRIRPSDASAYNSRGVIYFKMHRPHEAVTDFSKAVSLDTLLADAYYNRGNVYSKTGQFELAVADYTRTLKLRADAPDPLINRGVSFMAMGRYEDALSDFNEGLKKFSSHPDLWFNRARLFELQGKLLDALNDYSRGLELKKDPLAYYLRGLVKKQMGDYPGALSDFTDALKIKNNMGFVYLDRAKIFLKQGHRQDACNDLRVASRLGSQEARKLVVLNCRQ